MTLVAVLSLVLLLLLVYIGGAVSRYDQPDLTWVPEPLRYWYPDWLVQLSEERHADALAARVHRQMCVPRPVMGQDPRVLVGAR